jgi:hypothetical protein
MEVCAANCGRASKLNCVAAAPKSSWTFDEKKKKTTKKESGEATRANVKKEMAKPRMAKSRATRY